MLQIRRKKPREKTIIFFRTIESGIDVGQRINVGCGKFGKKNKRRALNKRKASESRRYCHFTFIQNFPNFDKRRAFNKAVGPGKKSKIDKRPRLFRTIE
jgi:hypothetical protein